MERSTELKGAPPVLPTSGEVVGWLASALRLADLRGGTQAFSESTAKRVARADAAVSDEMRGELLRAIVNGLFSEEYLVSRGLDEIAGREHNTVVLAGLQGALSTWDGFVGIRNSLPREYASAADLMGVAGVLADVSVRVGAYLAGFRSVVPASRFAWQWCSKPGLGRALELLLERADVRPSDNELLRSSKISRNTLRAIRDGESIPKEETILRLAYALARCGVRDEDGSRLGEVDLQVELRLACLVASLQALLDPTSNITVGIYAAPRDIAFFAWDFRRYDSHTLASIIAQGVRWASWPEAHERFKQRVIAPQVEREMARVNADVDNLYNRVLELLKDGQEADGFRLMAEETRKQARLLEEWSAQLPGWEKATPGEMHRLLEEVAAFWNSVAEGKEPPRTTRSGDTLRAKSLCDQAVTPWLNLNRAQRASLFEQAVEADPGCAYVRARAGVFFSEDPERADDAIRHLRVAIMQDPEECLAHITLAILLRKKDQIGQALEVIEPAATRPDATTLVVALRGELLLDLGRVGEAEECFVSVLHREPTNSLALAGRASVCRARGDRTGEARFLRLATLHSGARPVQAFAKVG